MLAGKDWKDFQSCLGEFLDFFDKVSLKKMIFLKSNNYFELKMPADRNALSASIKLKKVEKI
jgi:hypothetical protein